MTTSKRQLGLVMVTAVVLGNMIGSGVFLLPASLAPYGGFSLVGWVISAIGALLLAGVYYPSPNAHRLQVARTHTAARPSAIASGFWSGGRTGCRDWLASPRSPWPSQATCRCSPPC